MVDPACQVGCSAPTSQFEFPSYTAAERAADRVIHVVGMAAASAGVGWLFGGARHGTTTQYLLAISIYCFGLVGMLAASASYNLAPPSRLKAVLRRLDHAMIFVMIAGSYTPFAVGALPPQLGLPLCAVVWGLAACGIVLKLVCEDPGKHAALGLYLGMGWLGVVVLKPLYTTLPGAALLLLLVGGVVYSLGAFVHTRTRMPYHNVVWHVMVVVAAALHFGAIAQLVPGSR